MVDGSPARGMVAHDQDPDRDTHLVARLTDADRGAIVPAPVACGGVVCWRGDMIHGSSNNTSSESRMAFAVHFTAVDCELLPEAPLPDYGKYAVSEAKL